MCQLRIGGWSRQEEKTRSYPHSFGKLIHWLSENEWLMKSESILFFLLFDSYGVPSALSDPGHILTIEYWKKGYDTSRSHLFCKTLEICLPNAFSYWGLNPVSECWSESWLFCFLCSILPMLLGRQQRMVHILRLVPLMWEAGMQSWLLDFIETKSGGLLPSFWKVNKLMKHCFPLSLSSLLFCFFK